jgi:hypothetical protein
MTSISNSDIAKIEIANVIRDQVGEKTLKLVGARDFNCNPIQSEAIANIRKMLGIIRLKGGLSFLVKENKKGITTVGIYLNDMDLYDVAFYTPVKCMELHNGIHFSELSDLIEKGIER